MYLEENPEDLETAKALLGHAWTKTTLIYVGSSSRRASRAYNRFVFETAQGAEAQAQAAAQAQAQERIDLMRKLKHLPLDQWPEADQRGLRPRRTSQATYLTRPAGPGLILAEGTRKMIQTAYRRWLGFLAEHYPDDLLKPPADRITPDRVRAFIEHLSAEVRPTSVANAIDNLCYAARLIAPKGDWRWLACDQGPPCCSRARLRTASTGWSRPGIRWTSASS